VLCFVGGGRGKGERLFEDRCLHGFWVWDWDGMG
jgi:hypothetical protein